VRVRVRVLCIFAEPYDHGKVRAQLRQRRLPMDAMHAPPTTTARASRRLRRLGSSLLRTGA
jgi:hypothetical protein